MTQRAGCVVVVEDEFLIADLLAAMVEEIGMTVCGMATTSEEALALVSAHPAALVLLDVRIRGRLDGVETARRIRATTGVPIIFVTGSREPQTLERMAEVQGAGVLFKPISSTQLRRAVDRALGVG